MPLIVLMAVLPAVVATFGDVLTTKDAAWGLRALDFTGSDLPTPARGSVEAVVPSDAVQPAALALSGGIMRFVGTARPISESIASLLGGAALLFLLWPMAKALAGPRFSFWVVLLAAFHPALLALLLFPAPVSVGLACSVAAIWGHLEIGERGFRSLFFGCCIVLGLSVAMLIVGPIASATAAVLLIDAVHALILGVRQKNGARPGRNVVPPVTIFMRRLSAVVLGLILWGGVNHLLVGDYQALTATPAGAGELIEFDEPMQRIDSMIIGPLWGLAAIGAGRLLRSVNRRNTVKGNRPTPRLLLPWVIVAGLTFVWLGGTKEMPFNPAGWYMMAQLSLPLLCFAAYAIEEAARRIVSGAWILLAVALPLAVRLGSYMATIGAESSAGWVLTALIAAAVAWIFAKVMPALAVIPGMRRALLMAAVLLAIAVDAMDGVVFLFQETQSDAIQQFTAQLTEERPRDSVVLLTDAAPPPELTFVLRSVYPDAAMEIAPSWDQATARLDHRLGPQPRRPIVAAWGLRDAIGAASSEELKVTGKPLLFAGRELLLYVGESEPERAK